MTHTTMPFSHLFHPLNVLQPAAMFRIPFSTNICAVVLILQEHPLFIYYSALWYPDS